MYNTFEDEQGQYTDETLLQGIRNHTTINTGLSGFNCGDIDLSNLPDYIKELMNAIPDSDHKVWTEEKYGKSYGSVAQEWAQHLTSFGLSGRVVVAILACAWTECGWKPKGNPNKKELSGGGVSGTAGWANCGEGTIGFTHWSTKQKWIKAYNADSRCGMKLPEDEGTYTSGPHISDLDLKNQLLMTVLFYNNIIAQYGNGDFATLIAEIFLEKAGRGYKSAVGPTSVDKAYQVGEVYKKQNGGQNAFLCNLKSVPHVGSYLQSCGAVQFSQPGMMGPSGPLDGQGFARWQQAVMQMGKWYEANVHSYNNYRVKKGDGIRTYNHPQAGGVTSDCIGYVIACLKYFGCNAYLYGSVCANAESAKASSSGRAMMNAGFTILPFSTATAQPFDIMVRYHPTGKSNGHAEIYAGNQKSWSWGNIHDGINGRKGMPCDAAYFNEGGYQIICRYVGKA